MEREMLKDLLTFDPGTFRPADLLWGWKQIAFEMGVSEDTLQRWCKAEEIPLPRFGVPGKRRRVYLPRIKVMVLRAAFHG